MKRMGFASLVMVILVSTTFAFASQNASLRKTPDSRASRLVLSAMTLIHSDYAIAPSELPADPASRYVVIDIRLPQDFARNHVSGATNIPENNLLAQIRSIATRPDQPILLYGYSEQQSIRSVVALRMLHYSQAYHVAVDPETSGDFSG